jgi:hypothetical protein
MKKIDFSDDFNRAIDAWKQKHGLREDDAILLCLELFRIHQEHWDKIRHQEMPAFHEFRDSILKLGEAAKLFQRQSGLLLDELRRNRICQPSVPGTATMLLVALLAGALGMALGKYVL